MEIWIILVSSQTGLDLTSFTRRVVYPLTLCMLYARPRLSTVGETC